MRTNAALFVCALLFCAELRAQDAPAPASRAEQIEQDQSAKAQTLSSDVPTPFEQHFKTAEKTARRILEGSRLRLQVGGLPVPSGFAVGPSVTWQNANDTVRVNTWAVGSVRQYYSVGTGVELPRFSGRNIDITLKAAHLDMPQLDFYGEGPDSLKSNRTDYRREDTRFAFGVAWPVLPHVRPRCDAEQLFLNVGPGTSDAVTSTELKFGPLRAPGIDHQTNYLIAGCGLQFDLRDLPENPHKGTLLRLDYHGFAAEQNNAFSFTRASGQIEQYIPFFNRKRVIALHAAADLSFHDRNQVVPFYMQPTLGGASDLRGFRFLRFYDDNAAVANAEYRWEIFTGFDMAIFADAGEVFHRPSQFSLSNVKSDMGFGLRFNNQRNLVMRIDTGFSKEGFQVWVSFNKVF
jgi:outer membrane protein assembly factor BamA